MLEQIIVLGQIPGTNIQLNFLQVVVLGLSVAVVFYSQRELRRMHAKPSAQNKQSVQN